MNDTKGLVVTGPSILLGAGPRQVTVHGLVVIEPRDTQGRDASIHASGWVAETGTPEIIVKAAAIDWAIEKLQDARRQLGLLV
jgi:hypothetical protein